MVSGLHVQAFRMELADERNQLLTALHDLDNAIARVRQQLGSGSTPPASSGTRVVVEAAEVCRRVAALAALAKIEPTVIANTEKP